MSLGIIAQGIELKLRTTRGALEHRAGCQGVLNLHAQIELSIRCASLAPAHYKTFGGTRFRHALKCAQANIFTSKILLIFELSLEAFLEASGGARTLDFICRSNIFVVSDHRAKDQNNH